MKKLLVCDYDQTLNFDFLTFMYNLRKVRQFREKNNIFAISTGRCYDSIIYEIKKYSIPYDYLSCSDGMTLYDNNNHLLFASYIDPSVIAYLETICNWTKLIKEMQKYHILDHKGDGDVVECVLKTMTLENMRYLRETLKTTLPTIKVNNFLTTLYLKNAANNKSLTIEKIKELEGIYDYNIYTIGDHNNDVSMIRDYNGSCMMLSTKKARMYSLKRYLTVGQFINDIMNDKAKVRIKK